MQFFTNEAITLEKTIAATTKTPFFHVHDIDKYYEIERCIEWIKKHNYKKVCLQFPDHLLTDSSAVALRLQENLHQSIYILADTSYESCCVDYVAAAHIDADAIIHYGPVCFSQLTDNVPYLLIHEKFDIDIELLRQKILELKPTELIVLLDSEYLYVKEQLDLKEVPVFHVHDCFETKNDRALYVGANNKKMMHLRATLPSHTVLFVYNPQSENKEIKQFEMDSRIIKRRYFLSEKIKDSKTIGIAIGTLAVKNYLKVVERMKQLLAAHKKKYYVISVGRLTVAKFANFPEIELYVLISCAMNDVLESRDFYQTIVTPFDVEIALNNKSLDSPFSYDYNHYLDFSKTVETPAEMTDGVGDVSLITGKIRNNPEDEMQSGNEVALKSEGTVAVSAEYLNQRSWKGLEQNLGRTEVKLAEMGRSGTAFSYENEL